MNGQTQVSKDPQILKQITDLNNQVTQAIERIGGHVQRIDRLGEDLRGNRPEPEKAPADTPCRGGALGSLADTVDRLDSVACALDTVITWLEG
jgi:hypothetical protein